MTAGRGKARSAAGRGTATRKKRSRPTGAAAEVESAPLGSEPGPPEQEAAPLVEPAARRVGSGRRPPKRPAAAPDTTAEEPDGPAATTPLHRRALPPPDLEPAPPPADVDVWASLRAAEADREPLPDERSAVPSRRAVAATAFAAIGIAVAAAAALLLGPRSQAPSVQATSGPEQTTDVVDGVAGVILITETFDDLPMDSTLPDPWTIDGQGPVRVAALPTSVDRSIRISSAASGEATIACRPTDIPAGRALRIAMDYRVGRALPQGAQIAELRGPQGAAFALLMDAASGRVHAVASPDASNTPSATSAGPRPSAGGNQTETDHHTSWRRVEISISATGGLEWQAHDVAGEDAGSGSLAGSQSAAAVDTVCIASPAGAPAGWIAIDDLLIEG
jgi:hypothetical protein